MEAIYFFNEIEGVGTSYQNSLLRETRRESGIYYTGLKLAYKIIEDTMEINTRQDVWNLKFLEPAVGVGNFVFSYLKYISDNYKLNPDEVLELYKNIYACDSDKKALAVYKKFFLESAKIIFGVSLPNDFVPNIGGALGYDLNSSKITYISIENYFQQTKFDIIVTNPPYKNLRAEKRQFESLEEFKRVRNNYESIKDSADQTHILSGRMGANIYKYFVEDILVNYSKDEAIVALLIPTSILTDKSCATLRSYILNFTKVRRIVNIPENNEYIDAQQALSYLTIDKKGKSDLIIVSKELNLNSENDLIEVKMDADLFFDESNGNSIFIVDNQELEIFKKMKQTKTIKEIEYINNMRGELDLSINKSSITDKETDYILVRGRDIQENRIVFSENIEYVDESFVDNSSKNRYIFSERLAGQQIVNIKKIQRLNFAKVPPNIVLGNSCNYIYVGKNEEGICIDYLQGLMNSRLMNWYFKLFSSNNHVNNYEIDNLPIPTDNKEMIKSIANNVREYNKEQTNMLKELIDKEVENLFIETSISLSTKEKKKISEEKLFDDNNELETDLKKNTIFEEKVIESIKIRGNLIAENQVLNNHKYSLSELDMQIIKSVPQGGNWLNIPQEIMDKSQRLLGIQKTGGRTTLYGRLNLELPSYTITTYFNRPGNGCNIHPVHNRVLSTREGARLQGFPDDFYFVGNQRDILNQIGNAVPPMIGYLFGVNILNKINAKNSIDLFSGAGGLLLGMKKAGINHVLANDIDRSACLTLKTNNPEIEVIWDDITKTSVKEEIIKRGISKKVDIICGGPPCQGFLAGNRDENDPRNRLVFDFADVVREIRPKVLLFENVVGILSSRKGESFKEIKKIFSEIGYDLHAEKMNFSEYGVPQRRIRVVIVGVRNDLGISASEIFPVKYSEDKVQQITVDDAISDLFETSEVKYTKNNKYQNLMQGLINLEEYYLTFAIQKQLDAEQLSLF